MVGKPLEGIQRQVATVAIHRLIRIGNQVLYSGVLISLTLHG